MKGRIWKQILAVILVDSITFENFVYTFSAESNVNVKKRIKMRNIIKHMVCVWLCAVMILGMLTAINVDAAEVNSVMPESGIQENAIGTQSIIEKDNTYYFSSFEELKELASKEYNGYFNAIYEGTEPLVIKENLTIPDNLSLIAMENEIQIPKSITLHASNVGVKSLIIEGTMEMVNLNISEKLVVNGTLKPQGYINLNLGENAYFSGSENIEFTGFGSINLNYTIKDYESLKNLLFTAASPEQSEYYHYTINVDCETQLIVSESLSIPSNVYVDFDAQEGISVNEGCTLSVDGTVTISCSMIVNGILNNNERINLNRSISTLDNTLGVLMITEKGKYEGSGVITIPKQYGWPQQTLTDPQLAVPGLNLNDFEIIEESDYNWQLRNAAHLTKLGTPTDLTWGYRKQQSWEEEAVFPGAFKFSVASPFQGKLKIAVYRVDGDSTELWYETSLSTASDTEAGDVLYCDYTAQKEWESGTYYFEVTQIGDYIQYRNSDTVRSENYVYVKPDEKLDKCTNLIWNGFKTGFEGPADDTNVDGYEIAWYFADTESKEPQKVFTNIIYCREYYKAYAELSDYLRQTYGDGYYYYRVRALSNNIEVVCNGEWSDLSPAYYITESTWDVNNELESIIDSGATAEEIKESVQAMGNQNLQNVMLMDASTVDKIAQLEELVGGAAKVEVTEEAYAFEQEQISVIGANLNDTINDEGVTLIIDKPEQDRVIPELYDSSVAVHFSMKLENVENIENLEVPVQITLPVPSEINPDFLVILHYHADGSAEELKPYVYQMDDQYYAKIILAGFSDFVMTQNKNCVMRFSGETRYETGYKVADALKESLGVEKFEAVVVATGKTFADALAGSYLAVEKNAPILLTNSKDANIAQLHEYITANVVEGGTVYILGGEGAVSGKVDMIEGYTVKRLFGNSRYDTNLEILKEAGVTGDEIIVATGKSFADSLSASAAKLPILLVKPGAVLNDAQKAILANMNKIYIIGGEGAVSKAYETELKAYGAVERVYGNSRYETSIAVANTFFTNVEDAVIASGKNFPDGLCGGPLAAAMDAPLILTADGKTNAAEGYIQGENVGSGYILGGTGAIGDDSVVNIFGLESADEIFTK